MPRSIALLALLVAGACTAARTQPPDAGDSGLDARDASVDAASAPDADADADADAANVLPQYQPYPDVAFPEENPFSAAKALLGKALFWDEQLSADDSVACGTCHRPAAGGADPRPAEDGFVGHPGEDGIRGTSDDPRGSPGLPRCVRNDDGGFERVDDAVFGEGPQITRRRAMSFLDAMFSPELFWDGRAPNAFVEPESPDQVLIPAHAALESQAVMPLQDTREMACEGFRWSDLTSKLARVTPLVRATEVPRDLLGALEQSSTYPALFQRAFGTEAITPARIAFAIATYERTLTSRQTPWDRYVAGDRAALSAAQARGYELFIVKARCGCCHAPPLFGAAVYGNDGFSESTWDEGRAEVTGSELDRAAFRVPSLRNVGLREAAGLLHDGAGAGRDLDTLIARYNEPPLFPTRTGLCVRAGLGLTAEELADLTDFVRHGLTDPRAASEAPPFDRPRLADEARRP